MKKIIISTFILFLGYCQIFGQYDIKEYQKHEFSVGILGGIHALDYDLSIGKLSNKFSGGIGVGYTYFFKKNIGLATGIDLAFYNAEVKIDQLKGNHAAFDLDKQYDFDFRYDLQNYVENQNAFYLNVPIMLHYQFTDGDKVKFYAAGGAKIGVPVSGKYKSVGGNLKTTGYYSHDESTLFGPRYRGFGDFVTKKYDSELKYKIMFNLALEAGAKWTLPNDLSLYTGLYLDYGLNDIMESKKRDLSLVQYNQISPEDHIFNGVANSSYMTEDGRLESMVNKINAMAYGVKIRLAFGK